MYKTIIMMYTTCDRPSFYIILLTGYACTSNCFLENFTVQYVFLCINHILMPKTFTEYLEISCFFPLLKIKKKWALKNLK